MKSFFERFKRQPEWPDKPRTVHFDETGFSITEEGTPDVHGDWAVIREVFAYKLDFFAYDEICIGLRFDETGTHWWIGESYLGYREFLDELTRRFPGIRTDWFDEVVHPAFATNRTTLWGEQMRLT